MFPLLHVAQSAAEVATVNRPAIASALAVFAAALAAIWRPAGTAYSLGPRRLRGRLFSAVAGIALFLAALPLVVPVDHILVTHAETAGHDEVHTAHCHNSPGSCSELPLASGPGQFMAADPLTVAPAFMTVLLLAEIPAMHGLTLRPEVRPPRVTAAPI